jgi:D-inositol-3-phosphate glycosyltransferase
VKIALVHCFYGGRAGGGGGVRQMTELARELKALGHECIICSHEYEPGTISPDPADEFEIRSVNTGPVRLPSGRFDHLRFSWFKTRDVAALVPSDVDAINVHEQPGQFVGWWARRLGVPVVWTRNDYTLYEFTKLPEETWLPAGSAPGRLVRRVISHPERTAARAMDAICVLDTRNARMVENAYGRSAQIVRSGAAEKFFEPADREAARAALGLGANDFLVLGVGILMPYRRFEDLIAAMGLIDDEAVHARIIGSAHLDPGYADQLRGEIDSAGLERRVTLLSDGVSDDDLRQHYAAADAFVFPNERQTWGLAPIEAIAVGVPVIVSRGAGVHEVLEGRAGVQICDERDPGAIAEGIRAIRADPDAFDVAETRAWLRAELTNRRFAEQMVKLFESPR